MLDIELDKDKYEGHYLIIPDNSVILTTYFDFRY